MKTYYAGLDLHKSMSVISVKDENGKLLKQAKVTNDRIALEQFFKPFTQGQVRTALEATSNYQWMYDTLESLGQRVDLAHPLKVKAIASAKVKTDKIDSSILSDLLRADLLPTSYVPPPPIRMAREIIRHRVRLVRDRAQIKNRVRAILIKINHPVIGACDIASSKARAFLQTLPLPTMYVVPVEDSLLQLDCLTRQIKRLDKKLFEISKDFPIVERLTEIPGIGIFSALVIVAEIGDIHRFESWKKLAGFSGLVPGIHQSAETRYGKSITHLGSSYLRWVLVEAASTLIRHPGPLRAFYLRLSRAKGHGKAIVAVARKLLIGIYHVWKYNEPFSPKGIHFEEPVPVPGRN